MEHEVRTVHAAQQTAPLAEAQSKCPTLVFDDSEQLFVSVQNEILVSDLDSVASVFGQQHFVAFLDGERDEAALRLADALANSDHNSPI